MSVRVLLVDYGEVICRPQPAECLAEMARLCALDRETFTERYWRHRADYDRGLAADEYWQAVSGGALDEAVLADLRRVDTESWMDIDPAVIATLDAAHERGLRLGLLSNAPADLAFRLDSEPALRHFETLLFSARLGVIKPEPAIYAAALRALDAAGDETLFIDDRAANVEGAIAAGLRAIRFSSAGALRDDLARLI